VGKNRFGEEYVDEILREHVEEHSNNVLRVNFVKEYEYEEPKAKPNDFSQEPTEIEMPDFTDNSNEEPEDFPF